MIGAMYMLYIFMTIVAVLVPYARHEGDVVIITGVLTLLALAGSGVLWPASSETPAYIVWTCYISPLYYTSAAVVHALLRGNILRCEDTSGSVLLCLHASGDAALEFLGYNLLDQWGYLGVCVLWAVVLTLLVFYPSIKKQ